MSCVKHVTPGTGSLVIKVMQFILDQGTREEAHQCALWMSDHTETIVAHRRKPGRLALLHITYKEEGDVAMCIAMLNELVEHPELVIGASQ